jgi:hypothetical protein
MDETYGVIYEVATVFHAKRVEFVDFEVFGS